MFTRGRHDVYMCYVGPAAGQCREQCLTQWITGRCRHDLVVHGSDLEVQVLGGGHLHVGVGLVSVHQEGARGSPRLEDSSSSPNAGIVEALGGMNPHPLVGGAEVSAALRAINVLEPVMPRLDTRAFVARVKGIPLTARRSVSPAPVPLREIAGSATSSFHLSTACGHTTSIKQLFARRLRV